MQKSSRLTSTSSKHDALAGLIEIPASRRHPENLRGMDVPEHCFPGNQSGSASTFVKTCEARPGQGFRRPLSPHEPQPTRAACARRGAHGSLRATQEPVPAAKGSCGRAAQTAKAGARHCCCSAWRRAAEVGAEQTRLRGRNACTHSHLETRTVHITHPSTLESLALKKLERNCFRV